MKYHSKIINLVQTYILFPGLVPVSSSSEASEQADVALAVFLKLVSQLSLGRGLPAAGGWVSVFPGYLRHLVLTAL